MLRIIPEFHNLYPRTCSEIKDETGSYQPEKPEKRYLHFGVPEHNMAAIINGIAYLDSGLIPYSGRFLVFAEYIRVRCASRP